MPWWGWVALGALLLGSELLLVDAEFYLVFLGVSAALVGLAGLMGLDAPVWAQWLSFAFLSVFTLVFFRRRLHEHLRGDAEEDRGLVGAVARVHEAIPPGGEGRAELRGSLWTVRNAGAVALAAGSRAVVERAEGVVLTVRPAEPGPQGGSSWTS